MPDPTSPEPESVRRSLRALATGEAPRLPTRTTPGRHRPVSPTDAEAIVEEATTAFEDVDTAVGFVDDGGLDRLRVAIDVGERTGDRELARAGQRLLAQIEHYRAVADGDFRTAVDGGEPVPDGAPTSAITEGSNQCAGDHFHSARGTVLSARGQVCTE